MLDRQVYGMSEAAHGPPVTQSNSCEYIGRIVAYDASNFVGDPPILSHLSQERHQIRARMAFVIIKTPEQNSC